MKKFSILLLLMITLPATAALNSEKHYQDAFCLGYGLTEVRLPDLTRVDCLTLGYALEVDFAAKWYQAIGQTYHYAFMTGRLPGIVLIMETAKDCKYLDRLEPILAVIKPEIKLWEVGPYASQCP